MMLTNTRAPPSVASPTSLRMPALAASPSRVVASSAVM
jgi:hypothetical protein